jgi:FkbM family methyltransferase
MNYIKKVLFRILSQKYYLKTLQISFYVLYDLGILKKDPRFKYHYLIKELIQDDYTVLDIGANLGYFAKSFARLANKGEVICVEPVPLFYSVLKSLLKSYPHVKTYNVALGSEAGKITMVLPETNGVIRTGLPHIASTEEDRLKHKTQEVEIVRGSELLNDVIRLDYVKCDVEGYELTVFTELKPVIEKFKPYVQLEIAEKNKASILHMFEAMGYTQFGIANFKFVKESGIQNEEGDYLFVPQSRLNEFMERQLKNGFITSYH